MLTCKEVVKVVSSDDRASWRKRLQVRMHLLICRHCRKYVQQLEHLGTGVRRLFRPSKNHEHSDEIQRIEAEVLKRIK